MNRLSFVVYLLFPLELFLFSLSLKRIKVNQGFIKKNNDAFLFEVLYISLFFSLIFGLRFDVGIDFMHYYNVYKDPLTDLDTYNSFELFFKLLCKIGRFLHLPPSFFFVSSTFIQIFFYLYAFKAFKDCIPYAVFSLFFIYLFTYLNVIRQCTAYSVILCAYSLLSQNKRKQALLLFCISIFLHRSALVVLPVIFLCTQKKMIIDNFKIQIVLFFITVIMGRILNGNFFDILLKFISNNSIRYLIRRSIADQMSVSSGLGLIVKYLTYLLTIFLLKKYNTYSIVFMKRVFCVGYCFVNFFTLSIIFNRIGWCFMIVFLFLVSYVTNDYFCNWKRKNSLDKLFFLMLWGLLMLSFTVSFIGTSNQHCVPFHF